VAGRWCDSSGVLSARSTTEVGTRCMPAHQPAGMAPARRPCPSSPQVRYEVFHPTLGFNI
jgi:hypothetical protein